MKDGFVPTKAEMGDAYFDEDRRYRYALSRFWQPSGPLLLFIGLNPSTADETRLDPTLRRLTYFSQREGFAGFWVGNLFAYRATSPNDMKHSSDPVGPDNDDWLRDLARWCDTTVVGWGTHGSFRNRDHEVKRLLRDRELMCFGLTKRNQPKHPLYIPNATELHRYQWGKGS